MPPSNPAMVTKVSSKLAKEISAEVEYDASNHAKTWQVNIYKMSLSLHSDIIRCPFGLASCTDSIFSGYVSHHFTLLYIYYPMI